VTPLMCEKDKAPYLNAGVRSSNWGRNGRADNRFGGLLLSRVYTGIQDRVSTAPKQDAKVWGGGREKKGRPQKGGKKGHKVKVKCT